MLEWINPLRALIGLFREIREFVDEIITPKLDCPNEPVAVADRFIELFKAHGITRTQIPRFFGHGLTLAKLKTNEILLEHLTDDLLDAACDLFAVRREWLDGVDEQIFPYRSFYKYPEKLDTFLDEIESRTALENCGAVAVRVEEGKPAPVDCVFVIMEPIGWIGNKEIYRFHLCGNWVLSYGKSRAYFAACAARCWKRGLAMRGIFASERRVTSLNNGDAFVSSYELSGNVWHPENFSCLVEDYLTGFNPSDYQYRSAIGEWLSLYDDGWMDFGHGNGDAMAAAFRSSDKLSEQSHL